MDIIQFTPIFISLVALIVSCFSFRYNKNRNKVEKAIDLAKTYKSLMKDISEFILVFKSHKKIHDLILKVKIDETNNFTYEELSNYYTSNEIDELNYFFNDSGMNVNILHKIYLSTKIDSTENIDDSRLILYYRSRFVDFLNTLEYFSMAFIQNVADDDVVYQSLHQTFLAMVKYFYFLIVFRNKSVENKYYTNIAELYIKWLKQEQKHKNKVKKVSNKISKYKKKC